MNFIDIKEYYNKRFLNTRAVFGIDVTSSLVASMSVLQLVNILVPNFEFGSEGILLWLGLALISSIISFWILRVNRAIIRYSTLRELGRLCVAVLGKEILLYVSFGATYMLSFTSGLFIGMLFVDFFVTLGALILIRVFMVAIYDRFKAGLVTDKHKKNVLVYGISDKAASMVGRLRNSSHYRVSGFMYIQERSAKKLNRQNPSSLLLEGAARAAGAA